MTDPTRPAFATTGMPGPTPDDVPRSSSTVDWKFEVESSITSAGMSGMPATNGRWASERTRAASAEA